MSFQNINQSTENSSSSSEIDEASMPNQDQGSENVKFTVNRRNPASNFGFDDAYSHNTDESGSDDSDKLVNGFNPQFTHKK